MNIEVVKEIRFAVVMSGGVSLAIYINGVAQELLGMVRATAVKEVAGKETFEFQFDDKELNETEKIYRALSYLLGDQDLLREFAPQITDENIWESIQKEIEVKNKSSAKIVRFVVDIMSGSSAGGINAIYLSKALVCGQNIDELENLWIKEGDFSLLLNDDKSTDGTELEVLPEPPSLFNSQRMYLKLLEAFGEVDKMSKMSRTRIQWLKRWIYSLR